MADTADASSARKTVAVIGGGPAGLMAAEVAAAAGARVTVYDRSPSVARKFLLAGRGGLNLTHSEEMSAFMPRYGAAAGALAAAVEALPPRAVVAWCEALGQATFRGGSGRVFPRAMKASPLLRAWLARLRGAGVAFAPRHHWQGFGAAGTNLFLDAAGALLAVQADATILALGGASWPRLGSDGGWVAALAAQGVAVSPLRPANCGFDIGWSAHFRERHAGAPLKNIAVTVAGRRLPGEAMITQDGLEGGVIYAHASALREALSGGGAALEIDLKPGLSEDALAAKLGRPRGGQSFANYLRKCAGLDPAAIALLREGGAPQGMNPATLARHIKQLPLAVRAARPIARAISTSGGIAFAEMDERLMLKRLPGVFAAGEMLDWEAPTGGYLLQACFSTGAAAGRGAAAWVGHERNSHQVTQA